MKLFLAPMDAITHQAFRNLVGRFGGCDEYFNEMINASSLLAGGAWEKFYLLEGPEPEKLVWQMTDKNGEKMAQAASLLAERSGIGIDLNMGCSAPQIAKTGAGIAWMLKPIEETQAMVRAVKSALENGAKDGRSAKRLSVKLRLGDEKYTEEKLHSFCAMLIEEGVQMITLHARTQKQKHSRHSDWQAVERLALRFPQIPVILNGDVKDRDSYELAKKAAPHAQGIMIATAAAQKPWIFREIVGSSPTMTGGASPTMTFDAEELALRFIDDVERFQPQEFWKTRLQRFFAFYCLNFSFGHYFQTSMINAKDNDDARKKVHEYFEKCPNDRIIQLKF
ncbi:tRNA-dihydrouridine synthase family protein [Treponema sp. UBA3813]|uniref:tRNA-dihydrouridine synthase family protein n=1 Tax=Treponema sp. UBA3813 TaxID=1947715 RepID=UPI0025F6FC1A|nr:tRNA-dihydrouridine synthase family protein [Treponema sp. UBA3813]